MTDMTVARSILDQLGGARFVAMTGAREFVGSADSLTFKIGVNPKRVSQVRVTLTSADLYSVTFFRIGKAPQIESDVYSTCSKQCFPSAPASTRNCCGPHHEQDRARSLQDRPVRRAQPPHPSLEAIDAENGTSRQ